MKQKWQKCRCVVCGKEFLRKKKSKCPLTCSEKCKKIRDNRVRRIKSFDRVYYYHKKTTRELESILGRIIAREKVINAILSERYYSAKSKERGGVENG